MRDLAAELLLGAVGFGIVMILIVGAVMMLGSRARD